MSNSSRRYIMLRLFGIVSAGLLTLALTGAAWAEEKPEAKAVIAKALKAMGGEDKVAKFKAHTWKEKGTYYGMGDGIAYTATYAVQWPDKFRMDIEGYGLFVSNGDQ